MNYFHTENKGNSNTHIHVHARTYTDTRLLRSVEQFRVGSGPCDYLTRAPARLYAQTTQFKQLCD